MVSDMAFTKLIADPIIIEDGQWSTVNDVFDDFKVPDDDKQYYKIILGIMYMSVILVNLLFCI